MVFLIGKTGFNRNMKKEKKYYFTITEEGIMNPDFYGFRGGRIEVLHPDGQYAFCEFRFFLPERMIEKFRELIEGEELTEKEFKHFVIDMVGRSVIK